MKRTARCRVYMTCRETASKGLEGVVREDTAASSGSFYPFPFWLKLFVSYLPRRVLSSAGRFFYGLTVLMIVK